MCPIYPFVPKVHVFPNPDRRAYLEWISTARCLCSLLYEHKIDDSNSICETCYVKVATNLRADYVLKLRHFLQVGPQLVQDHCIQCRIRLTSPTAVRDCRECAEALQLLINYIDRSGERPHTSPRPTIVVISETTV